jgi:hypothetical protein
LLLLIVYGMLVAPLKFARRACYWSLRGARWAWSFVFFMDAAIWLATVGVLLWLAYHFMPELREAVHTFPSLAQQAGNDISNWWHGK